MKGYGLEFHHLGLAVAKKEKAVRFVRGLGYKVQEQIYDPEQKVYLILCCAEEMPDIEIISKSDEPGPLDVILKEQTALIYHICYKSKDIRLSLELMKEDGNRIIMAHPAKRAILFGNRPVSFYLVDGFGLIEIIEQ